MSRFKFQYFNNNLNQEVNQYGSGWPFSRKPSVTSDFNMKQDRTVKKQINEDASKSENKAIVKAESDVIQEIFNIYTTTTNEINSVTCTTQRYTKKINELKKMDIRALNKIIFKSDSDGALDDVFISSYLNNIKKKMFRSRLKNLNKIKSKLQVLVKLDNISDSSIDIPSDDEGEQEVEEQEVEEQEVEEQEVEEQVGGQVGMISGKALSPIISKRSDSIPNKPNFPAPLFRSDSTTSSNIKHGGSKTKLRFKSKYL